jgi:hypothetical protein
MLDVCDRIDRFLSEGDAYSNANGYTGVQKLFRLIVDLRFFATVPLTPPTPKGLCESSIVCRCADHPPIDPLSDPALTALSLAGQSIYRRLIINRSFRPRPMS